MVAIIRNKTKQQKTKQNKESQKKLHEKYQDVSIQYAGKQYVKQKASICFATIQKSTKIFLEMKNKG